MAVISVVLFHIGLAPGGFIGVDVFFVISGYLIGRILLAEIATGSFSILDFYRRRARRLFPALFVMLGATAIGAWLLFPPYPFMAFGRNLAAALFFAANVTIGRGGYFASAEAGYNPLLHLWSLAVEEQFYLALPLFLLGVTRFAPKRLMLAVGAFALLSLALDVVLVAHRHPAGFFQAPARAFELLIGVLLAAGMILLPTGGKLRDTLSIAGLLLIAAAAAAIPRGHFPGLGALVPCLGAALILYAGDGTPSIAGRWLSHPIPVFFGAISYSLYLWHWPLLIFLRYLTLDSATLTMRVGAVVLATVIATASWRFVELPFLERRVPLRPAWVIGGGALAALLGLSILIIATGGVPQRFSSAARAMFATARDISPLRHRCRATALDVPYAENCALGTRDAEPDTAIWSDSFGIEIAYALGEQAKRETRAILQVSATGCPPGLPAGDSTRACDVHNRAMLTGLIADRRIRTVVLVADYRVYLRGSQRRDSFLAAFDRGAIALHAAGKQLILVDPIPFLPMPGPTAAGLLVHLGGDPSSFGQPLTTYRESSRVMSERLAALAARTGARRVLPESRFCDSHICRAWIPAVGMLYHDDEHISVTGARYLLGAPGWKASLSDQR